MYYHVQSDKPYRDSLHHYHPQIRLSQIRVKRHTPTTTFIKKRMINTCIDHIFFVTLQSIIPRYLIEVNSNKIKLKTNINYTK